MEFETKGRKMSWLVKSAGIVMSEIILGNAGVGCTGPGMRQFITNLGSDTQAQARAHRHSHAAGPPCGSRAHAPRSALGAKLGVAGGLL